MLTIPGASLPQETKDKLFITSLENVEYSLLLETEARTLKWGWLFRTFVQWHAIAFLLSELCVRTKGEAVERAWRALEATAGRWWFPLNDGSPNGKGQQGCLWKPLKRLLAKAKAAREKELALEKASTALRDSNNPMFTRLIPTVDSMHIPTTSAGQPESASLDRMLRPSAPKLGETQLVQPSWPPSPPALPTNTSSPDSLLNGEIPKRHASGMSLNGTQGMHGPQGTNDAFGQEFHNLTNFGLDNVIYGVMQDMDYEGNEYDFNALLPMSTASLPATKPIGVATTTPALNTTEYDTARAVNGAHGTFGDASLFGNVDFADVARPDLNPDVNGQLTDSPNADSGVMDWTQWDDLVTQYGMEGYQQNASSNPASQGGLLHWF